MGVYYHTNSKYPRMCTADESWCLNSQKYLWENESRKQKVNLHPDLRTYFRNTSNFYYTWKPMSKPKYLSSPPSVRFCQDSRISKYSLNCRTQVLVPYLALSYGIFNYFPSSFICRASWSWIIEGYRVKNFQTSQN